MKKNRKEDDDCNRSAEGKCSEAKGCNTRAIGECSHAEGCCTRSKGKCSHAEGCCTKALGDCSHSEGKLTKAVGAASHAEGQGILINGVRKPSVSIGQGSHAEGSGCTAGGITSHAEGLNTSALGNASHTEGRETEAAGENSHAEGRNTFAGGTNAHAEGFASSASGDNAHAEGFGSSASGDNAHAEGFASNASGDNSHVEGFSNQAIGTNAHAEGEIVTASGDASHAEGADTEAIAFAAHAEGEMTIASGTQSHAEGLQTVASGNQSHAEGLDTNTAGFQGAHIMGRFGDACDTFSWFMAGGTATNTRAITACIKNNGDAFFNSVNVVDPCCTDYAEMFETYDGLPIDVGYFVTLEGKKIKPAKGMDEYILGVTSATPAIIAGTTRYQWHNKYIRDEWGRILYQEVVVAEVKDKRGNTIIPEHIENQPTINPKWNCNQEYIPRSQRAEWVAVGLMGQLLVRDDGSCEVNGYCKPNKKGIATKALCGYRVLERTGENQILIVFR